MCTLFLAEAGANVIKVERPAGDEMRSYSPKMGNDSVNFVLLNRGKKSVTVDLKNPASRSKIEALIKDSDVLVEQFRPGVMQRLGLDYETVAALNPRLVYCSITGYGQSGPKSRIAAHDLNYQAQTGMLALSRDATGAPPIPPTLTADLAGGTYPAMINILLALRQRERTGEGCHLDIAMADNLFSLMYWGLGNGWGHEEWPHAGRELVTGGSPRYQIYRTADNRYLAAAPLEDKFWRLFLDILGLQELVDRSDNETVTHQIAEVIRTKTSEEWMSQFNNYDTCVCEIVDLKQAVQDPHFIEREVFSHTVSNNKDQTIPALPVPIASFFRMQKKDAEAPALGANNDEFFACTSGDNP